MKMIKRLLLTFLLALIIGGCGNIQLKPLPERVAAKSEDEGEKRDPRVMYRFFDEMYVSGGYEYHYPDESQVYIPENSGKNGEVALKFDLIADEFSGGSVCLWNLQYDLWPLYAKGALEFWIKGKHGGEVAWAALVDDETSDGKKTVVRVPINDYGGIKDEWTKISIPLSDFGKRGVYWDPKKEVEVPEKFQWGKVCEFRIEIKKGDNEEFVCWVDDIFILRDVYEAEEGWDEEEEYWDDREETLPEITQSEKPDEVKEIKRIFDDALPSGGGFAYVYGGKTAYKIQPTEAEGNNVFACYMDNSDYSGVTLSLGKGNSIDVSDVKDGRAGLAFWARGGQPEVEEVFVGLLDDESDGKKVQTKLAISDYGNITTDWKYFMIPLKQFNDKGRYWDADKKAEVQGDVEWDKIQEVRFSVNRYGNNVDDSASVDFYIDDLAIIEDVVGWVDPEEYWKDFESDAPDVVLHDFESEKDRTWETNSGENSDISYEMITPDDKERFGSYSMKINYELGDYADCMYDYEENNADMERRDWSNHWGIRFSFYTEKPYQAINLQISDNGDELFFANVGAPRGWSELLIPFKDFDKFPYYQPPDAVENGHFDLDSIVQIDFKPSGEGTKGSFVIDNVKLTNTREIKGREVKEELSFNVSGDPQSVLTDSIHGGLFGINAALWDGDLLKPKTVKYVKAVNHGVLRYPGGLRADEDHWKEVLDKNDWMVDTDEMAEFANKTNDELMITVNFGRGTAEEAADWVKHMNKEINEPVKYWEVGNELYGDWHANQCSAEEYGKRARKFIKAMKEVDPDIKVTVVWRLEGDWNRVVFEHTKDIADGVNVHNYPQHTGEENDHALLASPQQLPDILGGVEKQLEKYGEPDKDYEVWLTEWNSVDFEPGPQTIKPVNGLFLIDYIGMLTRINIEQASYWDIHNNLTPRGGDYGYLTRTGDPKGDNVPRPSYYAFKLVSHSLRGKLCETDVTAENKDDSYRVTAYLAKRKDGAKTLLLVNKMQETKADVNLNIPGFTGEAEVKLYTPEHADEKLVKETIELTGDGDVYTLKPYSAAAITVE